MTDDITILGPSSKNLNRNWGWLFVLGLLFVILGCIGLSRVVGLTLVSMMFFGVILLIVGASQLIDVIQSRQWKPACWHALAAVLYLVGGGLVIYDPFLISAFMTVLLASALIMIGFSRLMMAMSLKDTVRWIWLSIAGLVAIAFGLMILMSWPISGLWVIGLFIAVQLIVDGCSIMFVALSLRGV